MLLKYKTVMMTGGASGIGRATVLMLAKEGARVILCDVNEAGANETIRSAEGGLVEFLKVELTDGASVDTCAKTAIERSGGKIDAFVNAAGWDRTQPFVEADQAFLDKVLGINLLGPLRLTRALFPAMIANGGGKIVFVASDAGRVGSLGETPYSAAKGGIIGFTKSLARELATKNINVNALAPLAATPMTETIRTNEKFAANMMNRIPMKRWAEPSEIAGAFVFMASNAASYITGQVLPVDGGMVI